MAPEEILLEIDATLDQLIQNAEAIARVDMQEVSIIELEAFQKTQESLIHHLLHTDQRLETHRKGLSKLNKQSASCKIAEKRAKFEHLKSSYHATISRTMEQKVPFFTKRRAKRFFIPVPLQRHPRKPN